VKFLFLKKKRKNLVNRSNTIFVWKHKGVLSSHAIQEDPLNFKTSHFHLLNFQFNAMYLFPSNFFFFFISNVL
jgi:hypothetical protein